MQRLLSLLHGRGNSDEANTCTTEWDSSLVLKRQYSALVPAFDPRPGHTNPPSVRGDDVVGNLIVNAGDVLR